MQVFLKKNDLIWKKSLLRGYISRFRHKKANKFKQSSIIKTQVKWGKHQKSSWQSSSLSYSLSLMWLSLGLVQTQVTALLVLSDWLPFWDWSAPSEPSGRKIWHRKGKSHYLLADVAFVGEAIMLAMRTSVEWELTTTPLDWFAGNLLLWGLLHFLGFATSTRQFSTIFAKCTLQIF